MDNEILLSRIQLLCDEQNISMTAAFVESGVGKNFRCNLKVANPSEGKITMLANYFGVSVAYLKGETDQRESGLNASTATVQKIVELLNQMTHEQQENIYSIIKSIISPSK